MYIHKKLDGNLGFCTAVKCSVRFISFEMSFNKRWLSYKGMVVLKT